MRIASQRYELVAVDRLRVHPRNAWKGSVEAIRESIDANGFYGACIVQASTFLILIGNHRYQAAIAEGASEVPCLIVDVDDVTAEKMALADNGTHNLGHYDPALLVDQLNFIIENGGSLRGTSFKDEDVEALLEAASASKEGASSDEKNEGAGPKQGPTLADRFGVPPFSVLDGRQGYWQDRKRQWLALGIESKIGSDGETGAQYVEPPEEVVARVVDIPHGSPLFNEIREYMRERLKASGITQKAVNDACGVAGMATHWFGNSQPEIPTPEFWEKLRPLLGFDDRYDAVMQSITRPPAEGTLLVANIARRKNGTNIGGGAPAKVGNGGLCEQIAPRKSKKKGAPLPDGSNRVPPAFGTPFNGGDAWRGRADDASGQSSTGTSIFDPVLCEILLRWFGVRGGRVLDPFAGGTSLAVVSHALGFDFTGVEVRADQVEKNNASLARLRRADRARFVCADSSTIDESTPGGLFDFVCTDPPYFDLEKYSQDERDGSTHAAYDTFRAFYANVLKRAASVLKPDRFFAVKIGEVRDRDHGYVNIVGDTIAACREAGLLYYNEAIIVTAVGSLSVRAARPFLKSRKLGKTHQNVLVFVKGDWRKAVEAVGAEGLSFGEDLPELALDEAASATADTESASVSA